MQRSSCTRDNLCIIACTTTCIRMSDDDIIPKLKTREIAACVQEDADQLIVRLQLQLSNLRSDGRICHTIDPVDERMHISVLTISVDATLTSVGNLNADWTDESRLRMLLLVAIAHLSCFTWKTEVLVPKDGQLACSWPRWSHATTVSSNLPDVVCRRAE